MAPFESEPRIFGVGHFMWYYSRSEDAIFYQKIEGIRIARGGAEHFYLGGAWVPRAICKQFRSELVIPDTKPAPNPGYL